MFRDLDFPLARPVRPLVARPIAASAHHRDARFMELLRGLRRYGGLERGDEVADRVRRVNGTDLATLARQIVVGRLLCFDWGGTLWLPLLQFQPTDMTPRPEVLRVVAELTPTFDALEVCEWLIRPNSTLDDVPPAALLSSRSDDVRGVARLDRFIACG
jgi:hypothetical protein